MRLISRHPPLISHSDSTKPRVTDGSTCLFCNSSAYDLNHNEAGNLIDRIQTKKFLWNAISGAYLLINPY
jgi:hypothetical protein